MRVVPVRTVPASRMDRSYGTSRPKVINPEVDFRLRTLDLSPPGWLIRERTPGSTVGA